MNVNKKISSYHNQFYPFFQSKKLTGKDISIIKV